MIKESTPNVFMEQLRHWELHDQLYREHDYESLIALQLAYIEAHPGNPRDFLFLADAYGYAGYHTKAMKVLKKLHKSDPWDFEYVQAMVECLLSLDKDPEAFNWRRPVTIIVNRDQGLNWCISYLKERGDHQEIFDVYCAMEDEGYVAFDLEAFESYLSTDSRFILLKEASGDVFVKLTPQVLLEDC